MPPDELARKEAERVVAQDAHERAPGDADLLIAFARRTAYVGKYRDAIAILDRGVREHPRDPRMYRHRGHRWITLRRFDLALRDLEQAARLAADRPDEPEPAGTPNARGFVIDTLKQNIHYHLALAHYLRGELDLALPEWRECARYSNNDDALCSVTHWTYMTLRRLGREDEARELLARLPASLDVIEYHGYHALVRMYRGEVDAEATLQDARAKGPATADFATVGYGVGNWHLYNGRVDRAREIFAEVASAPMWAAFGRIASEVEIQRIVPATIR
jgi:tetratricopeptide (TPR) repeat protein